MRYVFSAPVKANRLNDFRNWLESNESSIRKNWPSDWKLEGVYFSVFGFGGHVFEVHWDLEGYDSFESCAKSKGPIEKLQEEWFEFLDLERCSAKLLKSATSPDTVLRAR